MNDSKLTFRPDPSLRPHTWLPFVGLLILLGCSRPLDRPLEGAPPSRGAGASSILAEPPPTLTSPQVTATTAPAPTVVAAPSPTGTAVGRSPILSGLLPAPNALVPPGPVNIGARIAGSAELAEVTLTVNGTAVKPQVTTQDQRTWVVSYTGQLDSGKHDVRLNARDRDGRAGGYTWQFEVQPRPFPTRTAVSAPTRPAGLQNAPPPATPTSRPPSQPAQPAVQATPAPQSTPARR